MTTGGPASLYRAPSRSARVAAILGPLACIAVFVVDWFRPGPLLACPFRAMTGLDCPVCGATRATRELVRGDIAGAAGFNVLFLVALPFVAYAAASSFTASFFGRPLPIPRLPRAAWWAIAALALAFTVARNLPIAATGWLASYR